jgi:hypothetical protein
MKVDLTEDEIRLLMEAVEHFDAHLHSQRRESDEVKALLRMLQKLLKKYPCNRTRHLPSDPS